MWHHRSVQNRNFIFLLFVRKNCKNPAIPGHIFPAIKNCNSCNFPIELLLFEKKKKGTLFCIMCKASSYFSPHWIILNVSSFRCSSMIKERGTQRPTFYLASEKEFPFFPWFLDLLRKWAKYCQKRRDIKSWQRVLSISKKVFSSEKPSVKEWHFRTFFSTSCLETFIKKRALKMATFRKRSIILPQKNFQRTGKRQDMGEKERETGVDMR